MNARFAHLPIVVMAAVGSACAIDLDAQVATAVGGFERTLQISSGPGAVDLDVQTGSGSITVRRGADTEVRVVAQIRAHRGFWNSRSAEERVRALEANPPIVQSGNAIRLGEIEDRELRRNVSISYDLTVPGNTRVRSRSGSGSVDIASVQGPVEARTGSGRITIGRIEGQVTAETGSGAIEVLGAGGGLSARTGSGSVEGRDLSGMVEAHTGSGRIRVAYAGAGDGDFSTGSGGISVVGLRGRMRAHAGSGSIAIEGQPSGNWHVDSGSGGISLRLPADAAFDLVARSSSGGIHTNHPIQAQGALSRNSLQGRVRGGGPRLDLSTGSGTIRLE
jgi:DUF4097 and DUF4098 domain-containing protein YvlB